VLDREVVVSDLASLDSLLGNFSLFSRGKTLFYNRILPENDVCHFLRPNRNLNFDQALIEMDRQQVLL
jgi:hypothetical protein